MAGLDELLARNRDFARTDGATRMSAMPSQRVLVITCLDPRVDPATFLGLERGDAIVLRNSGGRVTPGTIADVALTGYLAAHLAVDGPPIEVAVIHHTGCSLAFLADDDFRADFAAHSGRDDADLRAIALTDPAVTVAADVRRLLASPLGSRTMTVSGHVLDLATGRVRTVLTAQAAGAS